MNARFVFDIINEKLIIVLIERFIFVHVFDYFYYDNMSNFSISYVKDFELIEIISVDMKNHVNI